MDGGRAKLIASAAKEGQFPRHQRREIAFVGRSNVGKSSLINRLLNQRNLARTSSTPGRTRTVNFYAVDDKLCFVDLPGYGYARVSRSERERWGPLIESYLYARPHLAGIIQVVDIRHAAMESDITMATWLRSRGLPALVVATKADKIARGRWKGQVDALARELGLPVIPFSAQTGEGVPAVRRWIQTVLAEAKPLDLHDPGNTGAGT